MEDPRTTGRGPRGQQRSLVWQLGLLGEPKGPGKPKKHDKKTKKFVKKTKGNDATQNRTRKVVSIAAVD